MLLLLNNDTEVITPNWIENMLKHALRPEVGAVGARLLYPDNTIQHGGVVVGLGGVAGHAFSRLPKDYPGYCGLSMVVRNFSAVTAACLMMRKKLYEDLGGLDEKNLADGFNDIDLCLRLREKNFRIVYTPFAELYHYEGLTRGHQVRENEVKYMQQRYENILKKGDPFYNPNLTLRKSDFSVKPQDEASFF
jgi:GT2 family glycosyltransferase